MSSMCKLPGVAVYYTGKNTRPETNHNMLRLTPPLPLVPLPTWESLVSVPTSLSIHRSTPAHIWKLPG